MKRKAILKYLEPFVHFLIWTVGFILIIEFVKTIGPFKRADNSLLYPVIFGTLTNITLFYSSSLLIIPRHSGRKLVLLLTSLLAAITIVDFVVDIAFFKVYYSTANESYISQFVTNFFINFIFLSLSLGYGYSRIWIKNERQKQQLKAEKLTAELNFLKAQVNPHFLFNVLNLAFASANKSGDEVTADIIERIASLMRYMLYDSNVEKVDIEKEIEYIKNFIALQKLRLSSDIGLKVSFNYDECVSCQIAPLILIPFVENAFKHGIKLGKESFINIRLRHSDGELGFEVENSKYSTKSNIDTTSSGVGLENVKKRLELIYPNNYSLEIQENNNTFKVELRVHLR